MYNIESKPCSKNGWFTPTEARNYYGQYARTGITIHWWGDGTGASNHDNIVNYLNGKGAQGQAPTANYVVSDAKITECVAPENVAWTSGNGNATTVGIEIQPTLTDEGYKKMGWLIWQLEQRFGRRLALYPHNHWVSTECPGTLDINRMRAEADKWAAGGYNPAPAPTPTPTVTLQITDIPNKHVVISKDGGAELWDLKFTKWADARSVKHFDKGTDIEVSAIAKHPLGGEYYLSEYSFSKGIQNGINVKDCTDVVPTLPVPVDPPVVTPPTPEPTPVVLPVPTDYDKQQDEEIKGIKAILKAITDFLSGLFKNFKI